jgi:peptidyl-prolyl cis-trans isomerase B (cyclophilin B)
MRTVSAVLLVLITPLVFGSASCDRGIGDSDEVAVIETSYGRIIIEFYGSEAPKHVANFRQLISMHFYDGTKIHRLVKEKNNPIALQGGDPNTINGDPATWGQGQKDQPTVSAEFSKTLKHVRGVVSAARKSNDVNSATSQFFICASPYPGWDGQYSIFAHVIEGMNVVDSIVRAPVQPNTDRPRDPVVVNRVYLAKRNEVLSHQSIVTDR